LSSEFYFGAVQTGSGAHTPSYPVGTGGCFPEGEADDLPASSAEIKGAWSYSSVLPYVIMMWYLVKHRHFFA